MPPDAIDSFITRWESSGSAERANYQMFRYKPTSPAPKPLLNL